MRKVSRTAALLLCVSAAACAPATTYEPGGERPDSRRLTHEQIRGVHASNALDAVRLLRPAWLQPRGRQSVLNEGELMVYYEQVRLGGAQSLRSIPAESIYSMEYFDAASATQRWGLGHTHGAILVVVRTR